MNNLFTRLAFLYAIFHFCLGDKWDLHACMRFWQRERFFNDSEQKSLREKRKQLKKEKPLRICLFGRASKVIEVPKSAVEKQKLYVYVMKLWLAYSVGTDFSKNWMVPKVLEGNAYWTWGLIVNQSST